MSGVILASGLEAVVEDPALEISMEVPATDVLVVPMAGPPGHAGPRGASADGVTDWITERPIGSQNALNEVFTTTYNFTPGSTRLFLNGMRQTPVESYVEVAPNQLELSFAPYPDEDLVVDYIKAEGP